MLNKPKTLISKVPRKRGQIRKRERQRLSNSQLMSLIQDLRIRPIIKDALADPAIEFRRCLLGEYEALKKQDKTSKKAGSLFSKSKEKKDPLATLLKARARRRCKQAVSRAKLLS